MNLNDPQRRGQPQLIIFLIVAAGVLIFLDSRGQLSSLLSALQQPLASLASNFSGLNDNLRQPGSLEAAQFEIDALKQRIEALEQENTQLRIVESEYLRILQLLEMQQDAPNITTVMAQVLSKGPNPAFSDLIIDVGTDDGVTVGMPVRSSRGLIGQVFRASNNAAQVVLLSDASVSVPVRLDQSRALGVVRGGGVGGLLALEFVDLEAPMQPGELILTAGLQGDTPEELVTNRFPRDLVVGRVVDIERSDAALFQSATVQPDVDFDTLETVFVITDFEEIDTTVFETEGQ